MLGIPFRVRCTTASKWCYSSFVVLFARRSREFRHPTSGGNHNQRNSWGSDFSHRLRFGSRPLWIDSKDSQGAMRGPQMLPVCESCGPADKVQRLFAMGQLEKAVDALFSTNQDAAVPVLQLYSSLLRQCSKENSLAQARRVHAHLIKHGLESTVGESVVCTLIECGSLKDAVQVFLRLPYRTLVSWKAVLSGYTRVGQTKEALRLYQDMRLEDCV